MLELIDPINVIEKRILRAIIDLMNVKFPLIVSAVEADIANNFARIFLSEPEAQSLESGDLMIRFGLSPSTTIPALDMILNTLANSVKVKFTKFSLSGTRINGGLKIEAVRDDFKDIIGLPVSTITTTNGTNLPWLEWLLLEGDKIVVADYNVRYGNFPSSRSGGGIMVESKGGFRVPPQYSGVIDNNWITRAIDSSIKYLEKLCLGSIERNLAKVL